MPVENGAIVTGAQVALNITQTANATAILEGTTSPDILALAADPCGLFGPPRPFFFYPRFQWVAQGSTKTIEFCDPVVELKIASMAVRGQNLALSGIQETLHVRNDLRLIMVFQVLQTPIMVALFDWWHTHSSLGGQTAIVLDRMNTCAGQWEFDMFNSTFSRAECQNNPMEPNRTVRSRPLYSYQFVFRQGAP